MADDKGKRGTRDRATVAGNETYEVDHFADKHGMTRQEAQVLIDRVGNSRSALDAAVRKQRLRSATETAKSALTGRTASLVGAAAAGLAAGLAVNLGRKMAVQAPSTMAGDWLDAIKLEHKMALALFDQLQATGDDATGKRSP